MFVTDGAVFMISLLGFSQICIDLIKNTIAKDCQTMLFSATYSDEVMDFVKRIIEKPVIFRLKHEEQSLSNIFVRQFYIECNNDEEKYDAVKTIYLSITIRLAMIFCCYKQLTVEQRAAIINRFLLNFGFPLVYDDKKHCFIDKPDYDTYLHRIGRAGRFGRIGHTFNLITPSE
ncbi:unnamed protein product [Rotaria sp. Silwood1]|nr:unnamed protein product [Rotaria sp. Silwood1]